MKVGLFVRNQALEDGENLFAVLIDAVQIGAERALEILRLHPLSMTGRGMSMSCRRALERVAAQEEAVEERRLALRS